MAKRLLKNKLIDRTEIQEEIKLIDNSLTDYVSVSGNIYKDYGNNKFLKAKLSPNKRNGYIYCGINFIDKHISKRVHILVAKAFIANPNNYPYVLHKDNDKTNNNISNLCWGTASENTQQAFRDGLIKNASGFNDSQSLSVCYFNLNFEYLGTFGSISEAAKTLGLTKALIAQQCKTHGPKGKPRKQYYFRYQSECINNQFIL